MNVASLYSFSLQSCRGTGRPPDTDSSFVGMTRTAKTDQPGNSYFVSLTTDLPTGRQASHFLPPHLSLSPNDIPMNLEFNKNEDVLKQSLSELRQRLEKIYEGGGKKAIEKQREKISSHQENVLPT